MTGQVPRTEGQRERVRRLKDARRPRGQDTPEPSRPNRAHPRVIGQKRRGSMGLRRKQGGTAKDSSSHAFAWAIFLESREFRVESGSLVCPHYLADTVS